WEIGAYPHRHVNLSERGSWEQSLLISRARSLLETRLGTRPQLFAYPYGAFDASTVSCVRDEGFTAAVTLRRGLNDGEVDPLQLKRLSLRGQPWRDLASVLRQTIAVWRAKPAPTRALDAAELERDGARTGAAL